MENKNGHFEGEYQSSPEQREYEEQIRRRMKERRRIAEKKRIQRNRTIALILVVVIIVVIVKSCTGSSAGTDSTTDTSSVSDSTSQAGQVSVKNDSKADSTSSQAEHKVEEVDGMTFVDGILIVNKTYSLPSDYAPGISAAAQTAFDKMVSAAALDGITLFVNSGYRSYQDQEYLYNSYATERGVAEADAVSSRPGHSEHQTGLSYDVNTTEFSFEGTPEAEWLAAHCVEYGFIIRFPKGKEDKTGYEYEPWHIRYLGEETAKKVADSGLCLEEYLGVTSKYPD